MPDVLDLADRLVLSEADTTVVPGFPPGWPFDLARWPVAAQWDDAPTRAQRAVAFLQLERLTQRRFEDGEDETQCYARILASIGLRWRETSACYQIVADGMANAKARAMGADLALGIVRDEEPGLFGGEDV